MNTQFPDYGILYIDDEVKSLKYFSAIFEAVAPIYVAESPEEGFRVFAENHDRIGLVLSDKKMPNESGIDLLRRIRDVDSRPFRFLVTAYADLDVAVESLNEGLLYSYLTKPWDPTDLENRLVKAIKHYASEREKDRLLEEKAEAFRQLNMADKAASVGILSTGLNHHLRNSLTVLQTFHEILPLQLEEELGHPPSEDSFWGDFHGSVSEEMAKMTDILSNLADGVRFGGKIEDTDEICLADVINDTIRLVDVDPVEVAYRVEDKGCAPVFAVESRIRQMFRVLLMEARDLLPDDGGEIAIELESKEDNGVCVTLLNNGKRIPVEELPYLFDPFYVRSQRPEKLGIGLLACYLTVASHGGTIRAYHSDDGRNAFEFQLPHRPPGISLEERAQKARNLFESARVKKGAETVLPA